MLEYQTFALHKIYNFPIGQVLNVCGYLQHYLSISKSTVFLEIVHLIIKLEFQEAFLLAMIMMQNDLGIIEYFLNETVER